MDIASIEGGKEDVCLWRRQWNIFILNEEHSNTKMLGVTVHQLIVSECNF